MLHEMHHNLRDMLEELRFPLVWVYGPTPTSIDQYLQNVIVIQRDRSGKSDAITAVVGVQRNARKMRVRNLMAELRIYARSSVVGAHIGNHERECEKLVDAMIVALEEWGTAARAGNIPITEARYLTAEERDGVETWPGVVYLIRFEVPRSVQRRDYDGNGRPEGGPTTFRSRTEVRQEGISTGDPEVGCGEPEAP